MGIYRNMQLPTLVGLGHLFPYLLRPIPFSLGLSWPPLAGSRGKVPGWFLLFLISFLGFYLSHFLGSLFPIPFVVLLGVYPSLYLTMCQRCNLSDLLGGCQTGFWSTLFCLFSALKSSLLAISCFEF